MLKVQSEITNNLFTILHAKSICHLGRSSFEVTISLGTITEDTICLLYVNIILKIIKCNSLSMLKSYYRQLLQLLQIFSLSRFQDMTVLHITDHSHQIKQGGCFMKKLKF